MVYCSSFMCDQVCFYSVYVQILLLLVLFSTLPILASWFAHNVNWTDVNTDRKSNFSRAGGGLWIVNFEFLHLFPLNLNHHFPAILLHGLIATICSFIIPALRFPQVFLYYYLPLPIKGKMQTLKRAEKYKLKHFIRSPFLLPFGLPSFLFSFPSPSYLLLSFSF